MPFAPSCSTLNGYRLRIRSSGRPASCNLCAAGARCGIFRQNSAEAAKWLWKAVAARNTTAEMALADLYARGDGVAKNCEQAKILLDSAAKRGVDPAAAQLKQLNDSGCQ